ncbi:MAG: SDR family oxidoreductase [Bacteroidota bacterium]
MILVTGGTGLVGSHLLYHLALENDSVKAIYRNSSNLTEVKNVFACYGDDSEKLFKKIDWVEAELNDIPALEHAFQDVTLVYHCAALVSFAPNDYQKMRQVNIDGTSNIVNLCISNSVKKLCFVSSIATIEKSLKTKYINEEGQWTTSTDKSGYAITKYGAEMEVWRASQEGVDVVIVNPGVILGCGFWDKGTGALFNKIYNGFKFYGEGITGFVGVIDVVKIMIQLMQGDIKSERFILVAENTSFKDIFYQVSDGFNVKRPSVKVSRFISEFAWRFNTLISKITGRSPKLTKYSARALHNKKYFNSDKISQMINYQFQPISETIEETCKAYLEEKNKH